MVYSCGLATSAESGGQAEDPAHSSNWASTRILPQTLLNPPAPTAMKGKKNSTPPTSDQWRSKVGQKIQFLPCCFPRRSLPLPTSRRITHGTP